MEKYDHMMRLLKAISDKNRLKILEVLSCNELCACELQCHFDFTQPTLSHHMKQLVDSGLVQARREGKWHYYRLNTDTSDLFLEEMAKLLSKTSCCPDTPFNLSVLKTCCTTSKDSVNGGRP